MTRTNGLRATMMTLLFQVPLAAQDSDIVDSAVQAGSFKTLVAAVEAAELVEALRGEGPFTVFAPTDEAFAALPDGIVESLLLPENKGRLARILQYHVVPGRVTAAQAACSGSASTLIGETLDIRIANGFLSVGSARVIANDISAANGIIHAIDSVLLPTDEPRAMDNQTADSKAAKGEELLLLAIERGVPLFNHDQVGACAAVYEVAIRSVLALAENDLPEEALSSLRRGLSDAAAAQGARQQAWRLRYGINGAIRTLRQQAESKQKATATSGSLSARSPEMATSIFSFDGTDRTQWFELNDDVMGGISTSKVSISNRNTLLFEGRLSLENNGGFASMRSGDYDMDLAGVDAFTLRVLGDGRNYWFGVRTGSGRGSGSWRATFETVKGEWTEVTIPVSELVYTFRGRPSDRGVVDPAAIRGMSVLISDKNDREPFRLEIDSIGALRLDN